MLMLLLCINHERYALPCEHVVEVLPLVSLKPLPQTPEYLVGVFKYQGSIVPVIDLCQFISGQSCHEQMSTRIILIKYWDSQLPTTPEAQQSQYKYIGLLAERVLETFHKSSSEFIDVDIQIGKLSYLGKMIVDEQGMIQYLPVEKLLSEAEKIHLLPEVQSS
ncbi:MAG TPA: chemotaxis protein CheW [Nostocaceae cyanobacterium]|nr:chemotaxis protein CheW [Nostocaceae cyanobacterium]